MRQQIMYLTASFVFSPLLLLSTSVQGSERDYQLCQYLGDVAETALMARYSGKNEAETRALIDDDGLTASITNTSTEAIVKDAFNRPHHRREARQMAEANDLGDVYYDVCLQLRGVSQP